MGLAGHSHDPQGRPAGVHLLQGPVQVTQTQSYNASGLRGTYAVTRTGTAPLTLNETFIYRGGQLGSMAVISNGVSYTDTFVYDQRGLPLTLIHSPAGSAAARYWYVLDGHANVVALTDSAGNVVDSYSYDAWGKPLSVNEQVTQPYRYASYWYDTELGWYWVEVRHYSPGLERWLQPDPSMQDGTLSYVYVGDDPVDAADPSGLGGTDDEGSSSVDTTGAGGGVRSTYLPSRLRWLKPGSVRDYIRVADIPTLAGSSGKYYGLPDRFKRATGVFAVLTRDTIRGGGNRIKIQQAGKLTGSAIGKATREATCSGNYWAATEHAIIWSSFIKGRQTRP